MAGGEGGWGRVLDSIQDLVMARPRKPKNQAPANGRSSGGQRAVLYARVSTAEQEKEGFSIDAQVASIREYAERMGRSEEHTSELQSLMRISYAVFCLKKKH